jgi:hypothetical protein
MASQGAAGAAHPPALMTDLIKVSIAAARAVAIIGDAVSDFVVAWEILDRFDRISRQRRPTFWLSGSKTRRSAQWPAQTSR